MGKVMKENSRQRAIAFIMAILMVFGNVPFGAVRAKAVAAEVNVVQWETPAATNAAALWSDYPSTGIDTSATIALGGTEGTSALVNGVHKTNGFQTKGLVKDGFYLISFDSEGYENLTFTAKLRASNSGARDFVLDYKTAQGEWTEIANSNISLAANNTKPQPVYKEFALPEGLKNTQKTYIRVRVASETSLNGSTIAADGPSAIGGITIAGTPISGAKLKAAAPTSSVEDTRVESGTEIVLSSTSANATIYYGTSETAISTKYTTPIVIKGAVGEKVEIYAQAKGDAYKDSDVAVLTYEIKPARIAPTAKDPITNITSGKIDIPTALKSTGEITVVGQVTYIYANAKAGILDSIVIQDVVNGEIVGIQINDANYTANAEKYKIGNVIAITGTVSTKNGVACIENADGAKIETISTDKAVFEPQLLTIQELLDYPEFYISEYVKIKNATVGKYAATGNTPVEDGTATTAIYRSAAIPEDMVTTKTTTLLGIWSKNVASKATTYQLRNGTTDTSFSDYTKIITYTYTIHYYFDNVLDDTKTVTKTEAANTKIMATSYADKTYDLDEVKTPSLEFTLSKDQDVFNVYYKSKPKEPEITVDQSGDGDPISESDIQQGVLTIKEAKAAEAGKQITLIGQLGYSYGDNGNLSRAVLQDIIENEVVGLSISSAMTKFSVGDVITLTGVTSDVNGVRQVSYTGAKLVKKATPLAPQTVTIEELKANSEKYVSEYIRIKEVTLGEYNKDILPITDVNGNTMNVWKAAAYPHDMKMGDKGEFYGVYAKQDNTLYCLRSGMMGNSWALGYLVDTECVLPIAKWEGSSLPAQVTSLKVNADSDIPGDELDDNSSLSVSTGKAPNYTNTSSTPKEYYLGYTGLVNNDYYQLETTASKYGNMSLKFQMRGSGTGPKNFEILYSTDGVNYKNSTNINYNVIQFDRTAGTTISTEYKDKSVFEVSNGYLGTVFVNFPREVNNEPKLYIRIQVTADSTTLAGKPLKNTAGVNRFVHINISGSPLIGDDICSTVSMNPKSKAVALNETVDLIPRTMGSTVYFSVNGSAYTIYTDNNKPIASVFPCTISAYAVKKNMSKSIKTTENYTQAQVGTVRFAPNGGNITTGSAVKLSCATLGAKIEYSTDKGITWAEYKGDPGIVLNQLPASIMAKATCAGYLPSEIKSVNFASRENEDYRTYFGQIHSHTNISDGSGTIDDAYEYASTKAKQIDYLVVTDHSNLFDNDTAATMINGSASTEWVTAHQAAKKYTSDKFVGLYGYEMTWSGGAPGHMNTYNTDGFLSRNDDGFKNGSLESLPNYYAELKKVPNSISQFNHPGNTFGDFYDFSYFDEAIDQQISLIEVGNGEGAVGSSGYFPSYEYYTRALDKGWHVAPTNNQDNHKGRWGDANTGRTVILADSLTESNIYDALRNMRVYATEDNNLKIKYTLNNEIMGTILSDKPENIKINVDLSDEDKEAIGKVEVIVNGGLSVASNTVSENAGKVEFNLSPDYSYYYIRVTQADGNIAVTAPVWTSSVESIGVSSISTKATLAVKGEDINVDTTLFNNEQDDFIVSSVKYTVGEGEKEREIHQVDLENNPQMQVVGAGQTPSYSFQYAHDGLGTTNINVIVKGTYQGVEKTYRGMLTLKYIAPEMTTNIVIDGTHDNDYVTGYNAGKMSNLVGIAAEKFAKVRVEETEITDSVLENCNLLIIAAPDRNVTKKFSDDFIETVKKYVERGGSVILCGAADKSDNINVQSSTELNRLLTAMGATTRLNSDQLQENNANNLNFSAFNIYSKHTKNLVQGQKYSAYNSCSVLLNEAAIAEGKAEALVYANEAVKSISNNSFGTNVPLADGTAVALAHEQVGTGSVFVAGAVFVSDYEIEAEVDYAGQLHSMNRSIFENILHEKKTRIPTSEIAQVRKSGLNEAFAVEGYVTAGTAVPGNVFFDAIYVQDDTAGITVFPIADTGIEIGQKIRLEGYVDAYQGDKEIQIFSYELLDGEKKAYEPRRITTEQAGNYEENGGLLVRISGEVTNIIKSSGIVQYIYVRDNTGKDGIVFADGYILPSDAAENEGETLVVGDKVSATGLVYEHPEGAVQQTCLRVRDRSEITKTDLITLGQKVASAAAIDVSLCSELAKENLQKAISNAQAAIDRNETNLIVMDDCRMAITKAVKMLWSTVGADYTAVNNAISSGRQINRQWYTRESLNVLDLAINAVIMGKDKSEQETVNAYAAAIYKAITMLVYKGADYSAVDAALKEAKKLDKDDFTEESWKELEKAMETVIIGKTILEQEEVNAYAAAIRFAIGKLQNIETEDEYIPEITTDDKEEDKDKEDLDKETSGKPGIVEIKTMDKVVTSIELNAISAQEKKDGFFYSEDGKKLKDAIIKTEDGKRFILNEKGEKYLSAMIESKAGTKYIVGETGAIITGSFIKTKGEIYYTTKSTGKIVTEKLIKVDGRKYYATSTGAFATGEILEIKGNLYYVTKKSGKVVENQLIKIDGKKYYAKKGGKLAASRWILVDGKKYYCNKEGIVTKTK